jgi:hypothetical protein
MDNEGSIKWISEVLEAVRIHRRLMKCKSETTSSEVSALLPAELWNIRCLMTMITTIIIIIIIIHY